MSRGVRVGHITDNVNPSARQWRHLRAERPTDRCDDRRALQPPIRVDREQCAGDIVDDAASGKLFVLTAGNDRRQTGQLQLRRGHARERLPDFIVTDRKRQEVTVGFRLCQRSLLADQK